MLLTPRYDGPPLIVVDVREPGPHPILGQRARLETTLRDLSAEEWQLPSRCAGWSVQDVVTHLVSTNGFWALSIQAGLAGTPTRFLAAFDPVTSPAELVDQTKGTPPEETLDQYIQSNVALTGVIDGMSAADWDTSAEAPPGHVPISLVADHALWDCWVHERDIVVPIGRTPVAATDEVLACLRYGAALGQAFALNAGSSEGGTAVLEVTGPADRVVVTVEDDRVRVHDGPAPADALVLRSDAAELVDLLSLRQTGREAPAGLAWLTGGLAEVFDQAG